MTATEKKLGEFRKLTECRLCRGKDLSVFIDFGLFPLAGAFLKPEEIPDERFYPMGMQFCRTCANVQVDTAVSGETLFSRYFYFSSAIGTLREHFEGFAEETAARFCPPGKSLAVEIGANDGVLLRPLVKRGVRCVGVDPAKNVVESIQEPELKVVNDFFTEQSAKAVLAEHGRADAILSSFSFAHIDDMHDVMRGIDALLADKGVFIFEVYYLGIVIREMQYDMMYHEHMSYYTLKALDKFLGEYGLEVFDVKRMPLRSGTLRFYAQRKAHKPFPVEDSVEKHREAEKAQGLHDEATFKDFGTRVDKTKTDLLKTLDGLKGAGKKVIGYGASGRGTIIMNYCGVGADYLDFVVDDAPAKLGYLTPGTHVPIKPWTAVEAAAPAAAVVFAWPFIEEVKKKRAGYLQGGGKFIVPLPEVKVFP